MKTNVFHLQVIPIKNVFPHEEYDQSRAKPLIERLKKDKHLANPIIVAPLGNNQYLQLDGMNRFSAFRIMKLPFILAQIIDYNDQESVELSSWVHIFKTDQKNFFLCTEGMEKISVKEGTIDNVGHRYIKEEGQSRLCTVVTRDNKVYLIYSNGSLVDKIKKLNKLMNCYRDHIFRDVLPLNPGIGSIELLFKEHSQSNMLMVFPTFTRHQIVDIAKKGKLFPPGVTRHIIKRRCLNLRIPLSFFTGKKSLDKVNQELEELIIKRGFRLYEEQTIYFE